MLFGNENITKYSVTKVFDRERRGTRPRVPDGTWASRPPRKCS